MAAFGKLPAGQFESRALEGWILAEVIEIIAILIAAANREDAGADLAGRTMDGAGGIARIGNERGQACWQGPAVDPPPQAASRRRQKKSARHQKAAFNFLRETARKAKPGALSCVMVGMVGRLVCKWQAFEIKNQLNQYVNLHQPIRFNSLVNKMG